MPPSLMSPSSPPMTMRMTTTTKKRKRNKKNATTTESAARDVIVFFLFFFSRDLSFLFSSTFPCFTVCALSYSLNSFLLRYSMDEQSQSRIITSYISNVFLPPRFSPQTTLIYFSKRLRNRKIRIFSICFLAKNCASLWDNYKYDNNYYNRKNYKRVTFNI